MHTENATHTPMTRDELMDKFNHLVRVRFGTAKYARLAKFLLELPQAASVKPSMEGLQA